MAYDAFMVIKKPDVTGETLDKEFSKKGAFEIHSFSFGASNHSTIGSQSGGGGTGKVSISSFNIMKQSDKASRQLFLACCKGDHFEEATVTLRKATGQGQQVPFLTYKFEEVFVDSIQWSGSGSGGQTPEESVSFSFGKLSIAYSAQDAKGGVGKEEIAYWDVRENHGG
jgi:type VI secretion system secreted protein Hcp